MPTTEEQQEPQVVTVEVPVDNLRVVRAALNSAYHHSMALDLASQYQKLSNRQQYSAMTKSLEGALDIIEAHVAGTVD